MKISLNSVDTYSFFLLVKQEGQFLFFSCKFLRDILVKKYIY